MSSFGGLMAEYSQIAIDRFQGDGVLRARGYFLSHCHADHMVGLESEKFAERLKLNPHIKLYCSEVTHEFLLTDPRFSRLKHSLQSLPIEQTSAITLVNGLNGKEEKLQVTLLPAGHCPGSVMFLFEGDEGTVLYTGDFRLAKGEVARMEPLHSGTRIKDITSVYLDTTFCVPEAMYIPSREESKDALLDLVDRQITQSPRHMVRLACKAKYGYEYLFVELSRTFNQKVHVAQNVMNQYERVPDLARHLTTEGSTTQIHACKYGTCSLSSATDVLTIQPSTMWFTSNAKPDDVVRKVGRKYRLCFSFHSSFSEVRDFLGYIRPKHVYPNVIPYGSTEEDVVGRLQDLLRGGDAGDGVNMVAMETNFKPLGSLKNIRRLNKKRQHDQDEELEELFGNGSPDICSHSRKKRIDNKVVPVVTGAKHDGSVSSRTERVHDRNDIEKADVDLKRDVDELRDNVSDEKEDRTENETYDCTFADSDGALSDSDSDSVKGDRTGNDDKPSSSNVNHTLPSHKGNSGTCNSFKINQSRDIAGEGKRHGSDDDDDDYDADGESIIPSQPSQHNGSQPLFSEDSQSDSQRSREDVDSWLKYLPCAGEGNPPANDSGIAVSSSASSRVDVTHMTTDTLRPNVVMITNTPIEADSICRNTSTTSQLIETSQPTTQGRYLNLRTGEPSSTKSLNCCDNELNQNNRDKVQSGRNCAPSSPLSISDETDSDATYICSQQSIRSEGSSIIEIVTSPLRPQISPWVRDKSSPVVPPLMLDHRVNGDTDIECSLVSLHSEGSSIIEISSSPETPKTSNAREGRVSHTSWKSGQESLVQEVEAEMPSSQVSVRSEGSSVIEIPCTP